MVMEKDVEDLQEATLTYAGGGRCSREEDSRRVWSDLEQVEQRNQDERII